jgi:hypothetical protein
MFSSDIVSMEIFYKVLSCYLRWFGSSGLSQAGYPNFRANVCHKDPALAQLDTDCWKFPAERVARTVENRWELM